MYAIRMASYLGMNIGMNSNAADGNNGILTKARYLKVGTCTSPFYKAAAYRARVRPRLELQRILRHLHASPCTLATVSVAP